MHLSEYAQLTGKTAIYPKEQALEYLGLGLVSEAGEVAGKIKKRIRDKTLSIDALVDELGDVYWYLAEISNTIGVAPGTVLRRNIEKLADRQARHALGGSGDTR